jgi:hypothetical protein
MKINLTIFCLYILFSSVALSAMQKNNQPNADNQSSKTYHITSEEDLRKMFAEFEERKKKNPELVLYIESDDEEPLSQSAEEDSSSEEKHVSKKPKR